MNAEDLKRFAMLQEFSDEDRECLFELLEPQHVRRGRSLYRETGEADSALLLVSGSVQLSSRRKSDLATVGEGAILGGAALWAMGQREATAKAETDCQVLVLERTAYRRLVDDHPRTATRLAEAIASELAGLLRQSLELLAPLPEGE